MSEIQKCVKSFFDKSLQQGYQLDEIIDMFKEGPLSQDLRECSSKINPVPTDGQLRRHGQLIGTQYIIKRSNEQSASLPETDLLAVDY